MTSSQRLPGCDTLIYMAAPHHRLSVQLFLLFSIFYEAYKILIKIMERRCRQTLMELIVCIALLVNIHFHPSDFAPIPNPPILVWRMIVLRGFFSLCLPHCSLFLLLHHAVVIALSFCFGIWHLDEKYFITFHTISTCGGWALWVSFTPSRRMEPIGVFHEWLQRIIHINFVV